MNSEIVIKITAQGAGQPMEASLQGESGTLPVPDRNLGTSGRLGTASTGNLPSPSESLGSVGRHSAHVPSPEESLSQMEASGKGELPKPVPPDEIENLGSKAESGVNTVGPPVPEPE